MNNKKLSQHNKINKEILNLCLEAFKKSPRYQIADEVIKSVINRYPKNTERVHILEKSVLINSLYNTNIYNITKMSEHIYSMRDNIDKWIEEGDFRVIENIRKGHGISNSDFYSFATKYVHWHNPKKFPIFDGLVKRLITELNKNYQFYKLKITQNALYDYKVFTSVIDSLRSFVQFENPGYTELDHALWIYAKCKYEKETLPEEFKELRRVISVGLNGDTHRRMEGAI